VIPKRPKRKPFTKWVSTNVFAKFQKTNGSLKYLASTTWWESILLRGACLSMNGSQGLRGKSSSSLLLNFFTLLFPGTHFTYHWRRFNTLTILLDPNFWQLKLAWPIWWTIWFGTMTWRSETRFLRVMICQILSLKKRRILSKMWCSAKSSAAWKNLFCNLLMKLKRIEN